MFWFYQQSLKDAGSKSKLPFVLAVDVVSAAVAHQLFDTRASAVVDAMVGCVVDCNARSVQLK